ncbi:hypothetical protein HWV62_41194 [Athelia sp. TMB]|nr:hypothetical protein HWV62_41194 [Athelia sp. TMB]
MCIEFCCFQIFIVPVDSNTARRLVPAQYNLLPVDETLLPNFPEGKFPLIVIGGLDFNISDTLGLLQFAQGRIQIPFVDRLGDGKTPFMFAPSLLMDNLVSGALAAVEIGSPVYPAIIAPGQGSGKALDVAVNGKTLTFKATGVLNSGLVEFSALSISESSLPWPHVEYDPVGALALTGNVSLGAPPLQESASFTDVHGVSASKFFSETLGADCNPGWDSTE